MSAKPESAKDDNTREAMQAIARAVDDLLPESWGFFVLAFPFGAAAGRMNYVANAKRQDILRLIKEFLTKEGEGNFFEHVEDSDVRKALEESVKLQSHYAKLLNQYDGGKRMLFECGAVWLNRLKEIGTL